jgi:hypothetical protein
MTFKTRTSAVRSQLPATRLLILLAFSVLVTWLLVYQRMVSYFVGEGIDPAKVGHGNIALQVFDATTVFFGFLVFLGAGILPLVVLFIRADSARSNIAQIIWAVTIVGLLVLSSATSY